MQNNFKYLNKLPENPNNNSKLIIMLHGVFSNADDLFRLKTYFENDYVFSLNGLHDLGGNSYAWYHLTYFNNKAIYNSSEVDMGYNYIVDFIEYIKNEYNLGNKQIYLLGFSQGANISYYLLGKSPELVSGIIALSGRFLKETAELSINKDLYKDKKVFIGHGTSDDVIPVNVVKDLEEFIESIGIKPVVKIYENMTHTILKNEMKDVVNFILN